MSDDSLPAMTSHRPYLLRALYEWIVDNGMTPHVLADATRPGVRVPPSAVNDGRVVLNIAERAVARLQMDNDALRFTARFGGVSHPVDVPMGAILAIYARETGQGMVLPEDIPQEQAGEGESASGPRVVDDDATAPLRAADDTRDLPVDDGPDDDAPPPRRGGHLRVVK